MKKPSELAGVDHIEKFKKEFKSLVYQKGLVVQSNNRLKQLHVWDNSDSHQNAIIKELETKKNLQTKFKDMLKGVGYEDWVKTSKRLTVLQSKLKMVESRKRIIETELSNFKSY